MRKKYKISMLCSDFPKHELQNIMLKGDFGWALEELAWD